MSDSPMPPDPRVIYEHPAIRNCLAAIRQIAGFELSAAQRSPFVRFHAYITSEPPPNYINKLRVSGNWYHAHVSGVLTDTQSALSSVYYHLANLERIESGVEAVIAATGAREVLGDSGMAVGRTFALDSEYQAFVLAVRRCLDYLTRSLAAYFKNHFHSFNKFSDFLAAAKPESVAAALRDTHIRHVVHLDFVLSTSTLKSTRDRIAHYRFVPAGVVNVSKRGFVLAGGGENLRWDAKNGPPPPLRQVLERRARHVQQCIDDLLDTFVDAARSYESHLSSTASSDGMVT